MVTRKHTRRVWLVPLAVVALQVFVAAGASGGDPPKPMNNYEKWQRYLATRQPTELERLRDTTHRPVNPKAVAAFERLQKASHQRWRVTWGLTTGCAAGLQSGRIWYTGTTRRDQATKLVNDYIDLFWQPDPKRDTPRPELRFSMDQAGWIRFEMYSQGVQVFDAALTVLFERDGSISAVNGTLPILVRADLSPKLTPQQAADVVRKKEKVPIGARVPDSPELVIFPSNPPRLMYSVFVDGGAHLLVDANTGEIYPGYWTGPKEYRGAADSRRGTSVDTLLPPSGHSVLPRTSGRSIPTSLEYVKEKYRRVTGRELDWHEPQVRPTAEPMPEPKQLGGGGAPTSPNCQTADQG